MPQRCAHPCRGCIQPGIHLQHSVTVSSWMVVRPSKAVTQPGASRSRGLVGDASAALIAPVGDSGVFGELLVGFWAHVHGCRCEVGRNRSRSLDFVALNIYPRPEPGQAKVTVRNINCTNQFPMNDQVGMTMS